MNQSEIIQPKKSISQMLEKPFYLKINSPNLIWTLPCAREEFFVFSLIPKEGQSIPFPTPKNDTQIFSFSSTKYGNVVLNLEKNSTLPEIQFLNFVITDTKTIKLKSPSVHLKRLSFQFPQLNYCLLQFIFQIHFSRLNFVLYLKLKSTQSS